MPLPATVVIINTVEGLRLGVLLGVDVVGVKLGTKVGLVLVEEVSNKKQVAL